MDLFEHAEETRQQRLALTWSGKNEAPADDKKVLLIKEPKRPTAPPVSVTSGIMMEEELAEAVEEIEIADLEEPIAEAVAEEIITDAAGPIQDNCYDEQYDAETYDNEYDEQYEEDSCDEEPEAVNAIAIEAPRKAVRHEDGATTSMLAINPVEINDEFQDLLYHEEDATSTAAPEPAVPKKLKLTRPAVIPEPEEEVAAAAKPKPSLKLTMPVDNNTKVLKPRKAAPVNNTCKLKPETTEIVADSMGGKLKTARELAGLTEYELAEKTRISSEYIIALEKEAFAELPLAPIYIKSYLKTLARQFGLNSEELINEYDAKTGVLKEKLVKTEPKETAEKKEKKEPSAMSKWLNWGIGAAAALLALLLIASFMVTKYHLGGVSENDMAIISDATLEESISQEFLLIRHMEIPRNETSAAADL